MPTAVVGVDRDVLRSNCGSAPLSLGKAANRSKSAGRIRKALCGGSVAKGMKKISYNGYRFPLEIIQQAIWLYLRFTLSFRDVEDLLAERGISVSYETVRRWVNHFEPMIAADLRKRRPKPHTTWHLDEVAVGALRRLRNSGRTVRGVSHNLTPANLGQFVTARPVARAPTEPEREQYRRLAESEAG
jgi:hypothetical protein